MEGASEVRAVVDTLSEFERAELARIESAMDAADDSHRMAVGALLLEVREKRLWREGYGSFEEYVEARHKISRSKAWIVAGLADVRRDVPEIEVERHARALVALPSDERKAAWEDAKAAAGGGKVTTRQVEEAAKAVKTRPRKPGPDATADDIEEYMKATGIIPEGADVFTDRFGDPDAEDEPEPEPREPTPEEWLSTLPARSALPDHSRKNFDADALLFREVTPPRLAYVEAVRPAASKAKKSAAGHIGAYLNKVYRFFQVNDPSRWQVCGDCKGEGRLALLGRCPNCHGHGYTL